MADRWVDFAYLEPNPDDYDGCLRYLHYEGSPRQNLTLAEVDKRLAAGKKIRLIVQQGKEMALGSFDDGVRIAKDYNAKADGLFAPLGLPLYYACDSNLDVAQVEQFYRGVLSVPGRPVGIYGSRRLLDWAASIGIKWRWQAAARSWSDYQLSPNAQLEQLNPINVASGSTRIDNDAEHAKSPAWTKEGDYMTRATMYPPADRTSQWFANAYPGSIMALTAPVFVLHTTEGGNTWPGYGGGAVAPTITALPDYTNQKLLFRQHFPLNMSARALRNLSGGVQTNTAGAIQIELCGTCVPGGPGMYWPEAPDWALRSLAEFVNFLRAEWGLPTTLPPRGFKAYPAGGDTQRLSFAEWVNFSGICGHQHVPENDHSDPGLFPIQRLLNFVNGETPPPPPVEKDWFDMATQQDLNNALLAFAQSPEARFLRVTESGGAPSLPVFMALVPEQGGKIYSLMPGQPKHWISPQEWGLLTRLFPQAQQLTNPNRPWGGMFLEEEVDAVWALLQPNSAVLDAEALKNAISESFAELDLDVDETELAGEIIKQLAAGSPAAVGDRALSAPEEEYPEDYEGMTVDMLESVKLEDDDDDYTPDLVAGYADSGLKHPDRNKALPSPEETMPGHTWSEGDK
jgi:hypothetical protein